MPNERIALSLPPDITHGLRLFAAEHGTNAGLVARAFIAHGLEAAQSAEIVQAVQDEKTRERARRSEIGRQVMAVRYAHIQKETT